MQPSVGQADYVKQDFVDGEVPTNGQNLCVKIKFSNKDRLFFSRVIKLNCPGFNEVPFRRLADQGWDAFLQSR